jgi:hypothetical protein
MTHHIIVEIEQLKTNKEKVKKFIEYGIHPKHGMSAEFTQLMFKLYKDSCGDTSYDTKLNCFQCHLSVYNRLKDFLQYNDNVGKPLLNWEDSYDIDIKEIGSKLVGIVKKTNKKDGN